MHLKNISFVFLKTPFLVVFYFSFYLVMHRFSCKYVKEIAQKHHLPLQICLFTSLIFTLLRGEKCLLSLILVLREPISTNNFAEIIFSLFPLFYSDKVNIHNKDNISIFYKILKISMICGYWVVYNY